MSTTTFEALGSSTAVGSPAAASLNRKRSRSAMMLLHDEDLHDGDRPMAAASASTQTYASMGHHAPAPPPHPPFVDRKRSRTSGVMDGLDLIPAAEAWQLNMDDMLSGVVERTQDQKTMGPEGHRDAAHSCLASSNSYTPGQSMVVLCVVESTDVQLRLLCASLPHLLTLSPTLTPILLTRHSPSTVFSAIPMPPCFSSSSSPFLTIPAKNHPPNHFLRLGLLHPLGGGHAGMDALVLIDPHGRRRLVVPFGWGVGRAAVGGAAQGAAAVGERLMEAVVEGVKALEEERKASGGERRERFRAARARVAVDASRGWNVS